MLKFDVAIIGSGLGGLLCGYILSKEGYSVCVIEKNQQIGGCLQTFTRDGCVFDTGIHYLGSLDEGQILHQYFKYFNLINTIKLKRLDENAFDRICFEGDETEYKYGMGNENFINILLQEFPKEKDALVKYIAKLKEICGSFDLYNLHDSNTRFYEKPNLNENAVSFLKSITNDAKLQNVLAGINLLYAGKASQTPLYIHSLVNYSYIQSAYRLVDGSAQIAISLANSISANDGIILRNHEVKKLIFDNDELKFVELLNNERIEAKYFISDVHPSKTLEMLEPERMRKIYWNRVHGLENTISAFTIYIVLKENSFPYCNYNYYLYKNLNVWTADSTSEKDWPENLFCFTPATSSSAVYAKSMIIMAYMKYDEVKKWENTTVENRGDEYLEFKRKKVIKILDTIEKKFPDLRENIKSYYTSSPLTYRDYTGTKEGSLYGIFRDCNEPYKTFVSHKTKIPNLFLTGQNINLHGAMGVTIGSVVTCSELLGMKYLVNKIKSA